MPWRRFDESLFCVVGSWRAGQARFGTPAPPHEDPFNGEAAARSLATASQDEILATIGEAFAALPNYRTIRSGSKNRRPSDRLLAFARLGATRLAAICRALSTPAQSARQRLAPHPLRAGRGGAMSGSPWIEAWPRYWVQESLPAHSLAQPVSQRPLGLRVLTACDRSLSLRTSR